jgi:hypothetical protein
MSMPHPMLLADQRCCSCPRAEAHLHITHADCTQRSGVSVTCSSWRTGQLPSP